MSQNQSGLSIWVSSRNSGQNFPIESPPRVGQVVVQGQRNRRGHQRRCKLNDDRPRGPLGDQFCCRKLLRLHLRGSKQGFQKEYILWYSFLSLFFPYIKQGFKRTLSFKMDIELSRIINKIAIDLCPTSACPQTDSSITERQKMFGLISPRSLRRRQPGHSFSSHFLRQDRRPSESGTVKSIPSSSVFPFKSSLLMNLCSLCTNTNSTNMPSRLNLWVCV